MLQYLTKYFLFFLISKNNIDKIKTCQINLLSVNHDKLRLSKEYFIIKLLKTKMFFKLTI